MISVVAVERSVIERSAVVQPTAVGSRDRLECCWATVVPVPLAYEWARAVAVLLGRAGGASNLVLTPMLRSVITTWSLTHLALPLMCPQIDLPPHRPE